ncbi:MAG: hypothetical protein DRN15_09505 [Thermoprotei archaeon]|nr:MAG: hypothetical protein DRN15_09505 [Thermoprotei archaeon]
MKIVPSLPRELRMLGIHASCYVLDTKTIHLAYHPKMGEEKAFRILVHDVIHETLHDILNRYIGRNASYCLDRLKDLEFWLYPEKLELAKEFAIVYGNPKLSLPWLISYGAKNVQFPRVK